MQSDNAASSSAAPTASTEPTPTLSGDKHTANVIREVAEYLNQYIQSLSNEGRIGFDFYQEAVPLLQLLMSHAIDIAADVESSMQVLESNKLAMAEATWAVAAFIRYSAGTSVGSTIEDYTLSRLLRILGNFLHFESETGVRSNGAMLLELGTRVFSDSQKAFWEYVWLARQRCVRINHPLSKGDIPDFFDELTARRVKDALRLLNGQMSKRALQDARGMKIHHARQTSIEATEAWLAELKNITDNARQTENTTPFVQIDDGSQITRPLFSMFGPGDSTLTSARVSHRPFSRPGSIHTPHTAFRNAHAVNQLSMQMEALQNQVANLRASSEGATSKTVDALDEAIFKSQLNHMEQDGRSTEAEAGNTVLDMAMADPSTTMQSDVLMDPAV